MAWPTDAFHTALTANQPVPSDLLNEMQERIIDLHAERKLVVADLIPVWDATAGNPYWTRADATDEPSWGYLGGYVGAGYTAYFEVRLDGPDVAGNSDGAIVTSLTLKGFNNHATTPGFFTFDVYKVAHSFGAATTAPAKGSVLAQFVTSTHDITQQQWGTPTLGSLAITVQDDERLLIGVGSAGTIGDLIAGLQVTYKRLTPQ